MRKLIRQLWPLLMLGFLINTAYSVMWPLTTIYLHNQLRLNLVVSGLILAAYSGCNVLGGYLGGVLADRYSAKRVGEVMLLGLLVDAAVGIFYNGLIAYPIVLVIFGLLTGGMLTLISALTAQLSHADSRLFNLLYIFINLGLVVGTASIGFLFHHSLRPIFGLLLICYGGAIGLWHWRAGTYEQQAEIPVTVRDEPAEATATLPFSPLMIVGLLVSLVFMWLTYAQWMSNVSVYIQAEGLGIKLYSYLWVYNGILLMVVQAVMARFSQPRFLMRQIIGGLLAIGGSFLLLTLTSGTGALFAAMTLLTLGEAIYVPGVPALINAQTVGDEGRYQGLVNACSSLGKAVGPVVGGLVIGQFASFSVLFLGCAVVDLLVVCGLGLTRYHYRTSEASH
ncbi:MFS transporter [Levilactobacillus brevis]|uniref:MFS transporter n=2 Tax=Levilactobacillus brevis TaxID=1580 RepID=UPI00063AF664|nr:MFS transporter [Levilactobacillus brevis]KLE29129.1 MFS transporter permease [Levilactobacillus brevis]MCT2887970.1 MFS transporter [Levilactobacillus brevis]MCT3570290.1 MFS transporter [Levilactobacillus brevis]MCT3579091.1 MFS transporter [Levilactobacillus brevis]MCT3584013.1 MFS transporter [Levilactobacillus brevis]